MSPRHELEPTLDGRGLRIGIVMSHCNRNTCENLLAACLAALARLGVARDDVTLCHVPGVLEIPLMLQTLAEAGDYDALIALGSVIRADKGYRYEVVCNTCSAEIARLQLTHRLPIANAILMTDGEPTHGLIPNGERAARTAVAMANLLRAFRPATSAAAAHTATV
ncbi:MAG: 6,7-dimethyl-8-ribityllumazine synthase [Thiobacillaceae bacterium]|nr:6,7-dimethyl-8-ribityllumazine synthase [Thiobacillaceae bacterium]MCX7672877.1 6,7-dimethyl-8-ribityllumazine synthase [Thiobacillaceae bacterium]MDW8324267.1 6,7-dimethyl-8-ribityllumazine synthase [Burkholderiales bacterium]